MWFRILIFIPKDLCFPSLDKHVAVTVGNVD